MKTKFPKTKMYILAGILLLYIVLAIVFRIGVNEGVLPKTQSNSESFNTANVAALDNATNSTNSMVKTHLDAAIRYFKDNMVANNGHVDLYTAMRLPSSEGPSQNSSNITWSDLADNRTNSEAVSYMLLWSAKSGDKAAFDNELNFTIAKMQQPDFGYMMWRLEPDDTVQGDGSNDASDADLRSLKALLIAEAQWHDKRYTDMIDRMADGLKHVAVTDDLYLAPYGGASGHNSTWKAQEVYLSYSDFTVLKALSDRYGQPWNSVYDNMKNATLKAQLVNGLYNSQLTISKAYGNGIDGGVYSINSLWMMVRNAESNDPGLIASANKSLQFYKGKFFIDAELYGEYGSDGDALSPGDNPWVYALTGRAAIALGDADFAKQMVTKLVEHQVNDTSSRFYGAFPEDYKGGMRIGQFTVQESILTMQDYLAKYG